MKAVIQRVTEARVEVNSNVTGEIGTGLVILLGIETSDTEGDADYLARKIAGLRIFNDEAGKMNRSVAEVNGALLIVSQFTLYGDCRKGMRPNFDKAARPEVAKNLYDYFVTQARKTGIPVETGVFQATMKLTLTNDGPVTLICKSVRLTPTE
jgi:D-tyrosyl-tRNA(Tyr) deacylase